MDPQQLQAVKKQLDEALAKGIITKSDSPVTSPVRNHGFDNTTVSDLDKYIASKAQPPPPELKSLVYSIAQAPKAFDKADNEL